MWGQLVQSCLELPEELFILLPAASSGQFLVLDELRRAWRNREGFPAPLSDACWRPSCSAVCQAWSTGVAPVIDGPPCPQRHHIHHSAPAHGVWHEHQPAFKCCCSPSCPCWFFPSPSDFFFGLFSSFLYSLSGGRKGKLPQGLGGGFISCEQMCLCWVCCSEKLQFCYLAQN